jgi:hypothetical protein
VLSKLDHFIIAKKCKNVRNNAVNTINNAVKAIINAVNAKNVKTR